MGKFRQVLTELSARDMPIFLFPDNNLVNIDGFSQNWRGIMLVVFLFKMGLMLRKINMKSQMLFPLLQKVESLLCVSGFP